MIERLRWAAYSSIGAGLIHGIAVGMHADHPSAARAFLILACAQLMWGIAALRTGKWQLRMLGFGINAAAIAGWVLASTIGIAFIDGLQIAEDPKAADTVCAFLAVMACCAIIWGSVKGDQQVASNSDINAAYITLAVFALGAWSATGVVHVHGQVELVDGGLEITADGAIVTPGSSPDSTFSSVTTTTSLVSNSEARNSSAQATKKITSTSSTSTSSTTTTIHAHVQTSDQAKAAASGWPRAFDPTQPINLSGIQGFTPEQGQRALALIENAKRDLPQFSSYSSALAAGYVSIGDEGSGYEHLIKYALLNDNRFLDTAAPESLVYKVAGSTRTLVSAMFIAPSGTAINDSTLVNYAGGLMQWHVHNNICWKLVNGVSKVAGILDVNGNCPAGSELKTGGAPMVHVWIVSHACGPFAALEGVGAGVADEPDNVRVDKCNAAH